MNRGIYTAATGMMAQQRRLEITANNLANVNTRGYKADRVTFGEAMNRVMAGDAGAGDDLGILSAGASVRKEDTDFSQGGAEVTGNALDLSLQGAGMFAIGTSQGVRYTRDGEFRTNGANGLVTQSGDPVLDGDGKPIVLPGGPVEVDANGAIHPLGRTGETIATLGRFSGSFEKRGGNLFAATDAKALEGKDAPPVLSGQLEAANVEPVTSMIEMITLHRAYETAQKMVQNQDEATGKLTEAMA